MRLRIYYTSGVNELIEDVHSTATWLQNVKKTGPELVIYIGDRAHRHVKYIQLATIECIATVGDDYFSD